MLLDLLTHPFFSRKPPRSAWRLDFGAAYADEMLAKHSDVPDRDTIATLCRFTAESIVRSINSHIKLLDAVPVLIASGGGTRNAALMRVLKELLPAHIRLTTSDEYGIPARFKEAIKFATLAFAQMHDLANNIPACSGASSFAILEKRAMPARLAVVEPGLVEAAGADRVGTA